jgi:hypothetical protein
MHTLTSESRIAKLTYVRARSTGLEVSFTNKYYVRLAAWLQKIVALRDGMRG